MTFPETSSRWLRVRVLDGQRRFLVDGVSVSRETSVTTERQVLPAPVMLNQRSPIARAGSMPTWASRTCR